MYLPPLIPAPFARVFPLQSAVSNGERSITYVSSVWGNGLLIDSILIHDLSYCLSARSVYICLCLRLLVVNFFFVFILETFGDGLLAGVARGRWHYRPSSVSTYSNDIYIFWIGIKISVSAQRVETGLLKRIINAPKFALCVYELLVATGDYNW